MPFCSCDLDLDSRTLIYDLDLNIPKMSLRTKMNSLGQGFQKFEHSDTLTHRQTDRHANRRNRTHYYAAFAVDNNMCHSIIKTVYLIYLYMQSLYHCIGSVHPLLLRRKFGQMFTDYTEFMFQKILFAGWCGRVTGQLFNG